MIMPGILCKCGQRLQYGEIPCPVQWLFISDTDYDKYTGQVDSEVLYREMKSFLKCNNCSRLWIFWSGFNSEPAEYLPNND